MLAIVTLCASTEEFCPVELFVIVMFPEELLARVTLCASTEEFRAAVLFASVIFPEELWADVTFPARDEFSALLSFATELSYEKKTQRGYTEFHTVL